jgi:hypothetical protein
METDGHDGEHRVGYRQPPQGTRFQKGRSGNTKGRPRGSKNLATLMEDEFNQRVVVRENGRQKKITKRAAAVKQFINKLVSADPRFMPFLLRLIEKSDSSGPPQDALQVAADEVLDPEQARQLQEAWKAIRASQQTARSDEEDV